VRDAEALSALVTQLRELGVAEYTGEVQGMGTVTLRLGPLPVKPEEKPASAPEALSPEQRWERVEKRLFPEG
jgi:hypothetical protein